MDEMETADRFAKLEKRYRAAANCAWSAKIEYHTLCESPLTSPLKLDRAQARWQRAEEKAASVARDLDALDSLSDIV